MVSRRKFVHRDSLQIQESKSQISAFYPVSSPNNIYTFYHFLENYSLLSAGQKKQRQENHFNKLRFFFFFFSRDKYISRLFNRFKKCLTLNCYHLSFHSRTDRKVRTPYSLIRWNSFRSHISFSAKLTSFRNMLTNIGKGFYIAA